MCCIAEIAIFVFGIVTLVTGNFNISTSRASQGVPARIIGAILLLPLIVGQGTELILGVMWGIEKGMENQQINFADAARELSPKALVINSIAIGLPLIAVLAISLSTAKPVVKKRLRRDDDDDDDWLDRRRRRRRQRDEDDERPRGYSPRDDDNETRRGRSSRDDDDDRPRRRSSRDDDDIDERIQ